jgi:hypothetical protein
MDYYYEASDGVEYAPDEQHYASNAADGQQAYAQDRGAYSYPDPQGQRGGQYKSSNLFPGPEPNQADADDDNFVSKLSKKVQDQARELGYLQNELTAAKQYSSLCEQRILELFPGHQLPITTSSLGSKPPVAQTDVSFFTRFPMTHCMALM